MKKIPILLITHNRPYLLGKVLDRLLKFTPWDKFELWILDNFSTKPNRLVIQAYKNEFKFINVFSQPFNQISTIQNQIIADLMSDYYIKLDDDILVTEDWYKGFLGVLDRHSVDLSVGSVVIPINGFGWIPFLSIMGVIDEFKKDFDEIDLIQGCTEPAVWNSEYVTKFIWEKCLDLDNTARKFVDNQKEKFIDYEVRSRYSIGAITFTHNTWEKMGGWKVEDGFQKRLYVREKMHKINSFIAKIRKKENQKRIEHIIDILTKINVSQLGIEEEHIYNFSKENGLKQYVTSESLVYHFSFFPTEEYLMKNVFLKIKW